MGIFSRLWNLFGGLFSVFVRKIERRNPEVAYENIIGSKTKQYVKLKGTAGAIISRRQLVEADLSKSRNDLQQVNSDLESAVEQDKDDIALILIQRKEVLDDEVIDLELDFVEAQKDASEVKGSLDIIKTEINNLNKEKHRMIAKMKSAEVRIQLQEQTEGISTNEEVKALTDARATIHNRLAESTMNNELNHNDLENRIKLLRENNSKDNAKKKLEELKAKKNKKLAYGEEIVDAQFEETPLKKV